jgi:phosphomannomutase
VATSHFVDAVAASYGAKVYETPVGFKYIGEYIRDGNILIGGEESAGLTVRGHVPEKDGILACLLVAEMVAVEGKSIAALLQDLYDRVGPFFTHRENIRLTDKLKKECAEKLASLPDRLAGKNVKDIIRIDGTKLLFEDGTWMLFRESGTEPVVRVYIEAFSQADLESMKRVAVHFIGG